MRRRELMLLLGGAMAALRVLRAQQTVPGNRLSQQLLASVKPSGPGHGISPGSE
jgi:hypothetical protein